MTNSSEDLRLWDAAADSYTTTVSGPADSFYRRIHEFLWSHLGPVADLDVLDLGCGHGWLAEQIRRAGARVTGIDGSQALLTTARSHYPEIDFHQHDLTLGLPDPARRYDRIVAHMVLMDVPALDRLLTDVAAALRDAGVFVFSILHPAFFSRDIVDEGPGGERYRKVTGYLEHETRWIESFGGHRHYHRPLSWYAEQLTAHGLVITGIHEPPSLPHNDIPATEWTEYQKWFSTIPTMLAMSCSPSDRTTKLQRG
ncbi:methyltransferase domain-containing protein [Nocardia sp. NPDC004604]|uniref:class I SAM-dependent DNA methyltransferase n=1 Tax=Nocardia sp. NPDC004604 TaxID=3157013 RepID=UPI0033A20858